MSTDRRELRFRGAFLVSGTRHEDGRGDFKRILGLDVLPSLDASSSYLATASNHLRGTIRGLHFQAGPHEEAKTIWCTTGAVFDVLVDLRPDEPTYGQWISVDLVADSVTCLHVPPGVAHGYQTVEDATTVSYLIGGTFAPESARTLPWDDSRLAIKWPLPVSAISENDRTAAPWEW